MSLCFMIRPWSTNRGMAAVNRIPTVLSILFCCFTCVILEDTATDGTPLTLSDDVSVTETNPELPNITSSTPTHLDVRLQSGTVDLDRTSEQTAFEETTETPVETTFDENPNTTVIPEETSESSSKISEEPASTAMFDRVDEVLFPVISTVVSSSVFFMGGGGGTTHATNRNRITTEEANSLVEVPATEKSLSTSPEDTIQASDPSPDELDTVTEWGNAETVGNKPVDVQETTPDNLELQRESTIADIHTTLATGEVVDEERHPRKMDLEEVSAISEVPVTEVTTTKASEVEVHATEASVEVTARTEVPKTTDDQEIHAQETNQATSTSALATSSSASSIIVTSSVTTEIPHLSSPSTVATSQPKNLDEDIHPETPEIYVATVTTTTLTPSPMIPSTTQAGGHEPTPTKTDPVEHSSTNSSFELMQTTPEIRSSENEILTSEKHNIGRTPARPGKEKPNRGRNQSGSTSHLMNNDVTGRPNVEIKSRKHIDDLTEEEFFNSVTLVLRFASRKRESNWNEVQNRKLQATVACILSICKHFEQPTTTARSRRQDINECVFPEPDERQCPQISADDVVIVDPNPRYNRSSDVFVSFFVRNSTIPPSIVSRNRTRTELLRYQKLLALMMSMNVTDILNGIKLASFTVSHAEYPLYIRYSLLYLILGISFCACLVVIVLGCAYARCRATQLHPADHEKTELAISRPNSMYVGGNLNSDDVCKQGEDDQTSMIERRSYGDNNGLHYEKNGLISDDEGGWVIPMDVIANTSTAEVTSKI